MGLSGWNIGFWGPRSKHFTLFPILNTNQWRKMSFQTTISFLKELTLSKTWWVSVVSEYKKVGLVGAGEIKGKGTEKT